MASGWPRVSSASLASVGISSTQGPHQVAQRFSTTALPLKSASESARPSAVVKFAAGDGAGAVTSSFGIWPTARVFRSTAGLAVQPAMTYRAPAKPAAAGRIRAARPLPFASARDMSPKSSEPPGHYLWGGRFDAKPDALMQAINVSIGFDRRLAGEDLAGSKAHAAMLAAQGIITGEDEQAIQAGLETIAEEIAA